ncbi:hypothetical protein P4U65_06630 [Bacillus pacificus]|nr:hypothetical protein [Bacillus thuringiensis]MED1300235.1 hypothetical protein [Bacillus pacificus]
MKFKKTVATILAIYALMCSRTTAFASSDTQNDASNFNETSTLGYIQADIEFS